MMNIPMYFISPIPLEHLVINEKSIKTIGKLCYDSSFYREDEALNESFANNVALIQKHIKHAPSTTVTIVVDNNNFYVSKDKVRNRGRYLADSEVKNVMNLVNSFKSPSPVESDTPPESQVETP